MAEIIHFPRKIREKVNRKFSDILAEAEREQAETKAGSIAYALLTTALLASILPYKPVSTFAAAAVLPTGITYFAICAKHPFLFVRKSFSMLAILILLSAASGCSAGFTFDPDQTVLDLCRDEFGASCQFGVSSGLYLFGYPLREASVEKAMKEAGIEKTYAIDRAWSGGVIGTSKIIVYGG